MLKTTETYSLTVLEIISRRLGVSKTVLPLGTLRESKNPSAFLLDSGSHWQLLASLQSVPPWSCGVLSRGWLSESLHGLFYRETSCWV